MTMSLGVGALVAPVEISDAALLHGPLIAMLALMLVAIVLGSRRGVLTRRDGAALIACYPIFVVVAMI